MTSAPSSARSRRPLVIAVAVVGVLALLLVALLWNRGGSEAVPAASVAPSSSAPAVGASPSPTVSAASPSPSPTPSPTPSEPVSPELADCTAVAEGFVPTRFAIPALGADERVVSLNLDDEGNIAAPPKDEPRTASWWNAGPRPGAEEGQALLSIHTYRNGGALGNELYSDGGPALEAGDVIKLYGDDGQVQCYEFTEALKVWVADYDPQSDVMIDFDGDPRLAIIICWDFNRSTENWDSRVFFYGTPVTPAA